MLLFYQFASIFALMSVLLFAIESARAGDMLSRVFNAFMAANFIVLSIRMITSFILLTI